MNHARSAAARHGLSVGFLTEGTYPYAGGGVSTWSQMLLTGLSSIDFHVIAATSQPFEPLRYETPANVRSVVQIPLWGASVIDSLRGTTKATGLLQQRLDTTDQAIANEFLPAFRTWLRCLYENIAAFSPEQCGETLLNLAFFLRRYDYGQTFRSQAVWQAFIAAIEAWYRPAPGGVQVDVRYTLEDVSVALSWMSALFRPLALTPPAVHLFHATVAAPVSLLGVVARLESETPFLLTEHGVYLRERTIDISAADDMSFFQKYFLLRSADVMARTGYHFADLIAPVCDFNARWEIQLGAEPDKVRIIYNAVDSERFRPRPRQPQTPERPTVVMVANVVPIKDVVALIQAAARVEKRIPNVQFLLYGSLEADPDYVAQCRALISTLDLHETVTLEGRHAQPELVYPQGDITVLASISEAFPFTVLESMSCARPVVATDVGGVSEALAEAGLLVPPRAPERLADAIVALLLDPERRQEMGAYGRARVLQHFTIDHLLNSYKEVYTTLNQM